MDYAQLALLFLAVCVIAFLYSSVGHAGASGYIATMALFGLSPTVIRPTALVLNSGGLNWLVPILAGRSLFLDFFGRLRCFQFRLRISVVIFNCPLLF